MKSARWGFVLLTLTSTAVALVAVVLLVCGYLEAWHTTFYEQRFASTIAVAHGQSIYQMPPAGPLFSCIYGPLSYLAFLPAALLPTVRTIFAAGSLMSTAFLLIPIVFAGYCFVKKYHLPFTDWGPLLLLPATAIACLPPLQYAASHVTGDSPAIMLMALSALFLYRDRGQARWTTAAYSAMGLVLSVGCKQNMVVAALIIVLAVFFYFPRKFTWLYLTFIAVFSVLAIVLVIAVYRDLGAVYFNDVVVPRNWPFVKANLLPGAYRLYENSVILALAFTSMGLIWFLTKKSDLWPNGAQFVLTFFAVAVALAPSSVTTYAAAGGDINSFAHAIYFFLLGIVITGFEFLVATKSKPHVVLALRVLTVVAALALIGSGLPTRYDGEWRAKVLRTPSAIRAYEFCKRNPGQVYFPSNSIGVYLAERKFYETDWGVMILLIGRQQLHREEIFKHIPRDAQYVALPRDFESAGAVIPFIAPHHIAASVRGLEDFVVFRIER